MSLRSLGAPRAILANLQLKLGYECVAEEQLRRLSELAHYVAEVANLNPDTHAPYVGRSAFAQLELARLAHGYELEEEMWTHLERCLAARPDGVVEQRLQTFLAGREP